MYLCKNKIKILKQNCKTTKPLGKKWKLYKCIYGSSSSPALQLPQFYYFLSNLLNLYCSTYIMLKSSNKFKNTFTSTCTLKTWSKSSLCSYLALHKTNSLMPLVCLMPWAVARPAHSQGRPCWKIKSLLSSNSCASIERTLNN